MDRPNIARCVASAAYRQSTTFMAAVMISAFMFALISPAMAEPASIKQAQKSLAMWQPKSISLDNDQLTVVLNEDRVTEEIYFSIITGGVCLGVLAGQDLPGISQIRILNQRSTQGYVYESGSQDCETINNTPISGDAVKVTVFSKTHLF